jgi:tetratricopeptide (TPR) repeat protein
MMLDLGSEEKIRVEQLIKEGKSDQALEIIRPLQQKAWSRFYFEPKKVLKIAIQNKDFLEEIGTEIDKAYSYLLLGNLYARIGSIETALKFAKNSLEIFEKRNFQVGLASSLSLIGNTYMQGFDFDQAIKFAEQALAVKGIAPVNKLGSLFIISNTSGLRGELSKALKYGEEGLKLAQESKNYFFITYFLYLMGAFHTYRQDFNIAKDYLKRNLEIYEKFKNIHIHGFSLFSLIFVFIEEKNLEEANRYLKQLEELQIQSSNNFINYVYSICKGVFLIQSGRTRDRAEAETLLKQVVEVDLSTIESDAPPLQYMTMRDIFAVYFLCNLYLEELGMSNNLEIIDEINPLISRLYNYATTIKSKLMFTYGKLLQAKLALIQMQFDESKKLFTEAQELAESENNQILAQRISNEHDQFLEQQDLWDTLEKSNAPFSERIKLASFDGVLDRIRGKQSEEQPELVPETPVFILIITESGIPLFSYSFSEELSFEDDIISSFISAFNTFSGELFSKGLDRARFGEYTILIETITSYSVCYLFKGQSYPAKQKLTSFIEELQENPAVWQILDKFFKTSQVAELNDLPEIKTLIKKFFIVK